MGFLDNSGDIILDAVLTETGRRRMAQGNFKITKFALGDDEIDYSLYNKNHPSGSAYYDLEILQTPIFEAFTQVNAGINYGLLATSATDLLYLPSLKINENAQLKSSTLAIGSSGSSGMFFVADGSNDSTSTTIGSVLDGVSIDFIDGFSPQNAVVLETGLDTGTSQTPVGSDANRQSLMAANNLLDNRMIVSYDNRFISGISGLTSDSTISNNGSSNTLNASMTLTNATRTNLNSGIENYSAVMVNGIKNGIVQTTSPNTETSYSNIQGPRGNVAAVAPTIKSGLDAEYGLYGGTTTIGGTSVKFIDTTIYVQGVNSSVQAQIPVRITKIA
tara:strand:+ start:312 stop:1307 length:996 start_codon:yes stop_codon:yes gene_type:complete